MSINSITHKWPTIFSPMVKIVPDQSKEYVSVFYCGQLCLEEITQAWTSFVASGRIKLGIHELAYWKFLDFSKISSNEIKAMVHFFCHLNEGHRVAVIAPTPITFGIARMYQAHSEGSSMSVGVFQDEQKAKTWLFS